MSAITATTWVRRLNAYPVSGRDWGIVQCRTLKINKFYEKNIYILIFVGKAQKRGFRKIKPQKNCPNSILAPTAWKRCHSTPFDYLSLIPVFDKRKKISVIREKPRDEGVASHHVMLTCSGRCWCDATYTCINFLDIS